VPRWTYTRTKLETADRAKEHLKHTAFSSTQRSKTIANELSGRKVGDHLLVTLSGGRIAEATVKAVVDTTGGLRLHVPFGDETALNYLWQVAKTR